MGACDGAGIGDHESAFVFSCGCCDLEEFVGGDFVVVSVSVTALVGLRPLGAVGGADELVTDLENDAVDVAKKIAI